MTYKQFSVEEREKIQELLWEKRSIREIAAELGRNPSSVSRELARNRTLVKRRYTPRLAHARALSYRKRRGREERLKSDELRECAISRLKLCWSPEQIAATAKDAVGVSVSHEAVYQFVYARVSKASDLAYGRQEDLRPYQETEDAQGIPQAAQDR